jgi:serine/threonine-protein kinase RsbW
VREVPETSEERSFPGLSFGARQARRWAVARMQARGVRGESCEDATLVLTELAANAVQHTRSGDPGGRFEVRLRPGRHSLWVEVADQGSEQHEPRLRATGTLATAGRGLELVAALAEQWWVEGDSQGRTVVAAIARSGPRPGLSVLAGTRRA